MFTKKDLIEKIAQNEEIAISKKKTEQVIDEFLKIISTALKYGESVSLHKFGTFEVSERKAKAGINIKTGERIVHAARKAPHFKASKFLKDEVKNYA